jgi:hypothetical protein
MVRRAGVDPQLEAEFTPNLAEREANLLGIIPADPAEILVHGPHS